MTMFRTLLAVASFLLGCARPGCAAAGERPRNVVIFLADDYGVMDVGANNPKTFYETPNLDRFAAQGVRFTQAYSANPVCSPTRYSIQTGKYPTRSGLTNYLAGARVERFEGAPLTLQMALEETTLAETAEGRWLSNGFRRQVASRRRRSSGRRPRVTT